MLKQISHKEKGILVLVLASLVVAWVSVIDQWAMQYANEGIAQSSVFFGALRLLNSFISMFQEVDVGVGVFSIGIGQLIDPLNDMIEYASEVIKLTIGSFLLQRVIVEVASTWLFNVLFTAVGLAFAVTYLNILTGLRPLLFKLFITGLLLRFGVALMLLLTVSFSSMTIDSSIDEKNAQLTLTADQLMEEQTSASDVSEELQRAILVEIKALNDEKEQLNTQLLQLQQDKKAYQYRIAMKKREIEAIKSELGFIESWRSNPEIEQLQNEIDAADVEIDVLNESIKRTQAQLETNEDLLAQQNEFLFEKSDGFFSKFMSSTGEALTYVKQLSMGLIDLLLELMVSFVFKQVLLPLLFLFGLIRIFRWAWGLEITEPKLPEAPKFKSKPQAEI